MTVRPVLNLAVLLISTAFCFSNAAPFRVGLVLDRGGKDDKSFNQAAYQGLLKAQKELGIEFKSVDSPDANAFEPSLRSFARANYDLVVGVGFVQQQPVSKIAAQFPKTQFAIVDAEVTLPNVRSLMFEEHEGSFLVGALAALTSKSNHIGFLGGMDIPLIRRFELGYTAGAKHINPKITVTSNYVGVTADAWTNPARGKELSRSMYQKGADVIYGAAGASTMGLLDAAEEMKKLAIGVDSNQNGIKPGFVLTSMLKRVDIAVFNTVKDAQAHKFTNGIVRYGLANEGVDFAMDENNKSLVSQVNLSKINLLKSQIKSGKISVPDFYKQSK
jgi:basic membrane protein A and related proteins